MKKLRKTSWFFLLVILLTILVNFTMAQETPTAAGGRVFQRDLSGSTAVDPLTHSAEEVQIELSAASRHPLALPAGSVSLAPSEVDGVFQEPTVVPYPDELQNSLVPGESSLAEPVVVPFGSEHRFDFSGRHVGLPQPSPSPSAAGETCKQLLDNTKLDMIGGSFPPWVVLDPNVYFSDTDYKSAQHSLFFEDNDNEDPTPNKDAFGQAFSAPSNLTQVTIKYYTKSLDSNTTDDVFGQLYTVDDEGYLDQVLGEWEVGQSPGTWQLQTVTIIDPTALQPMEGQNLAIVLLNNTNASVPNERVLFDDIEFTACYEDTGQIIVKKEANPADGSQFTFDPSWSPSNFQLGHGQSETSPALAPGSYSVKELVPSGWELESATCSDGSSPNSISLELGETVTCTFRNKKLETSQICSNVLVNSALNIVEFGDGTGTAEPWSILDPIVYYTKGSAYGGTGYSLFFEDGDDGSDGYPPDPSPQQDSLAQGLQMPGNLTEIRIEYLRQTINTNTTDNVYGNLWLLDDNWNLDLGNLDNLVLSWEVGQEEATWVKEEGNWKDAALMGKMSGKKMAIILYSRTDGGGSKEIFLFDEVYLEACSKSTPSVNKAYLPSIIHNFGETRDPFCNPPTENPFDQWHSNRGLVQTGAICSSNLSNVDLKDYYTFKPTQDGNHTLWLTELEEGTNWAASIWVQSAKPVYAPGGSKDGYCLASQPGDGDKQVVCNLNKGTEYFVRVDSGDPPVGGNYKMKITAP